MSATPEHQSTRCTRFRFRYSECRRCEQACPHDALRLSDEGVAISVENCRRCGLCVGACRTEAFGMPDLAPMRLIEKARGRPSFAIACSPSGAEADAIVPCLGALGPALLAYLVKQGTVLTMNGSDQCTQCAHGSRGSEQLALALDAVESLRKADADAQWSAITLTRRSDASAAQADDRRAARRQFFRRLSNPGQAAPRGQPPSPRNAAPLRAIRAARVAPSAQRDLLQMLGLAETEVPLSAHAALPAGDLRLEPACTGCEACARACPTGALQVRENDTTWALGFEAAKCVACGVCVETCQPRVLHLREAIPASAFARREAVALHALPKRRCTRCDRSFAVVTDRALCDVCAGDEQDFAAIFG